MVLRFQFPKCGEGRWIYCLLFSFTFIKYDEENINVSTAVVGNLLGIRSLLVLAFLHRVITLRTLKHNTQA